jgi:hypothetical protein
LASSHEMYTEIGAAHAVSFNFDNIHLPDSISDTNGSSGFVVYEIDQLPYLFPGTPISNKAEIYFDFNPAIVTNEVLNTISNGSHHVIGDTLSITATSFYNWEGNLYETSGLYASQYASVAGCDSTIFLDLTIEIDDAGLSDPEEAAFSIIPNPTSGKLLIYTNQQLTGIAVLNTMGSVLYSQNCTGALAHTMDLSFLPAGVYWIEMTSAQGKWVRKVVVALD